MQLNDNLKNYVQDQRRINIYFPFQPSTLFSEFWSVLPSLPEKFTSNTFHQTYIFVSSEKPTTGSEELLMAFLSRIPS